MGCLPRLWEAKGWQGCLNPSVLNQSSGKQDHKGCLRNKEDERVVLLKRFCKSLHKKLFLSVGIKARGKKQESQI